MNLLQNAPKMTPKDFFLYLGMVATLYISVISVIALWFRMIDEWFADPLAYSDPYSTGISLAIAALIVIFPLFLILAWMIRKDEDAHEEKKELGIRKWLMYLTIFVAGVTILIDLIVLLHTFLSGQEITAQFIAKVVVILVVVGAVFGYFFYKLRKEIAKSTAQYLTGGAGAFVVLSIIFGFLIMGSPQDQRALRLDQERISDLQEVQWRIVNYWQDREALPEELSELSDAISGYTVPRDPVTDAPYEYEVVGERTFELCAEFARASEGVAPGREVPRLTPEAPSKAPQAEDHWQHGAGRTCFERTIDPEQYPPRADREQ